MWTSKIKDKQFQDGVLRVVVSFSNDIDSSLNYHKTFLLDESFKDNTWLLNAVTDEILKNKALGDTDASIVEGNSFDIMPVVAAREAAAAAAIGSVTPGTPGEIINVPV